MVGSQPRQLRNGLSCSAQVRLQNTPWKVGWAIIAVRVHQTTTGLTVAAIVWNLDVTIASVVVLSHSFAQRPVRAI